MNEKKIIEARKMLLKYVADQIKSKEIPQEEISKKTGFIQSNISRMLSGKYPPSLDNFIKLLDAADLYIFIIDKDNKTDDLPKLMRERWKRSGESN